MTISSQSSFKSFEFVLVEFKQIKESSLCQNELKPSELNSAVGKLNSKCDEFSLAWKLIELHTFVLDAEKREI